MTRIITIAHVVWLEVLRRKDVYIVFALMLALLVLLMSFDIFGVGGLTGYVKEAGLLMVWIFALILSVTISSRLLPEEETRGTVFALLSRPVRRSDVIIGKWMGSWAVVSSAALAFYAAITLIVLSRGSGFCWITLAQGIVLHLCLLGMIGAMGVALSTRMNRDAAATLTYVLSLSAFLVLPRSPSLAVSAGGFQRTGLLILYYALPHFELFDIRVRLVHDWDPVPILTFAQIVVYGIIITAVFLLLGWMGYRRKRFLRGVIQ